MAVALFAITGSITIIPIFVATTDVIIALDFLVTPITKLIGPESLLVTQKVFGLIRMPALFIEAGGSHGAESVARHFFL
jgi:small neutral amino acid transporter SnatA (MarC family)